MIRPAHPKDAAAIAHVHRSARAEAPHPRHVTDAEWADVGRTFLWESGGAVVGFATLEGDVLRALYVLPGAQGAQIGTALLDFVTDHGACSLEVYADNDGARRLYERRGWVLDREDPERESVWYRR